MRIGVVKEIKPAERRVALTLAGAHALAGDGDEVVVEAGAGAASGFDDVEYAQSGARIARDAAEVWGTSELLMKVKEPIAPEYGHLREGLTLFATRTSRRTCRSSTRWSPPARRRSPTRPSRTSAAACRCSHR